MKYNTEQTLKELAVTIAALRVLSKLQAELYQRIEDTGTISDLQAAIDLASEVQVHVHGR